MKIAFYTLGCKTNQFETQALETLFEQRGHEIVPFDAFAHIYIVNTCTVTALSDKKSRNAARRCKKINPAATLIVCGCYSQIEPEAAQALCGADIVLGTDGKGRIVELAEQAQAGLPLGEYSLPGAAQRENRGFELLPAGGLKGRTRALLKVQDGCQNFCSYCIIPYARGLCRSIPVEEAAREAARLEGEGYCEIVITGIEVSSYGIDLPDKPSLAQLIAGVCGAAPHTRIRLSSLEPRTITPEFLRDIAPYQNLCPHFHLSLQSGCDATLQRMNRKYSAQRYAQSVALLQQAYPGCGVTTDLIVGFPGETRADFAASLAFIQACRLAQVHIFPYSRRKGTPAYDMEGQIPREERETRAQEAAIVAKELHQSFLQSKIGQCLPVLFEQEKDGLYSGFSPEYCPVHAPGQDLHNKLCTVRITGCGPGHLLGQLAE